MDLDKAEKEAEPTEEKPRRTRRSVSETETTDEAKKPVRAASRRTRKDEDSKEIEKETKPVIPEPFDKEMDALAGTLTSKIFNEKNKMIREIPVRDLANILKEGVAGAKTVIFDGVITQRIIDIAAEQNIEKLVGLKIGNVVKMPEGIKVFAAQN